MYMFYDRETLFPLLENMQVKILSGYLDEVITLIPCFIYVINRVFKYPLGRFKGDLLKTKIIKPLKI